MNNIMTGPGIRGKGKLHAVSMIRNEADLILPFLSQARALFDKLWIVDVLSTDGTREMIEESKGHLRGLEVYSIRVEEKYQSAILNLLSRKAFAEGAEWVFPLDGDEFLDVEDRDELDRRLGEFQHDVMRLPWINLVPSKYGSFTHFDPGQDFYWTGELSRFSKIALSRRFIAAHPHFSIAEGSHEVFEYGSVNPNFGEHGLDLLHVPLRSAERLRYKMTNAQRTLESKHNRKEGEGNHVLKILRQLEQDGSREFALNTIAANYGTSGGPIIQESPSNLGWKKRKLPAFADTKETPKALSLDATEVRDSAMVWKKSPGLRGMPVMAELEDGEVRIVPQPVDGNGRSKNEMFAALATPRAQPKTSLGDAVAASFTRIDYLIGSAWSELVPVLFALFAAHRPRRFVELGVHNGMSFFAGCQIAKALDIGTECVAIDSWEGDQQAGFYSTTVFDRFREKLNSSYPSQYFIQSYFDDALSRFDAGSIDLLHIDGFHSYEAVKHDFEMWLPKMSGSGVVIFHDTNVHRPDFGVWKLWAELSKAYPSLELNHSHGLGILYVGKETSPLLGMMRELGSDGALAPAQNALEGLGALSIEQRRLQQSKESMNDKLLQLWRQRPPGAIARWRAYLAIARSGRFDKDYYREANPEVRARGMNPIWHYVAQGAYELRNPNRDFNTAVYLTENFDVMVSGINPFAHYVLYGEREGRVCR